MQLVLFNNYYIIPEVDLKIKQKGKAKDLKYHINFALGACFSEASREAWQSPVVFELNCATYLIARGWIFCGMEKRLLAALLLASQCLFFRSVNSSHKVIINIQRPLTTVALFAKIYKCIYWDQVSI